MMKANLYAAHRFSETRDFRSVVSWVIGAMLLGEEPRVIAYGLAPCEHTIMRYLGLSLRR